VMIDLDACVSVRERVPGITRPCSTHFLCTLSGLGPPLATLLTSCIIQGLLNVLPVLWMTSRFNIMDPLAAEAYKSSSWFSSRFSSYFSRYSKSNSIFFVCTN